MGTGNNTTNKRTWKQNHIPFGGYSFCGGFVFKDNMRQAPRKKSADMR
jgi:hypothetical protein